MLLLAGNTFAALKALARGGTSTQCMNRFKTPGPTPRGCCNRWRLMMKEAAAPPLLWPGLMA
jgi:hypothetical protein